MGSKLMHSAGGQKSEPMLTGHGYSYVQMVSLMQLHSTGMTMANAKWGWQGFGQPE